MYEAAYYTTLSQISIISGITADEEELQIKLYSPILKHTLKKRKRKRITQLNFQCVNTSKCNIIPTHILDSCQR